MGRTFESLRAHRNYRLYFAGQVVSFSGTWAQAVAQAWLVLQLTGSPAAVGLLSVCQYGPFAILGLPGGTFLDRSDIHRTLMTVQSVSIAASGLLAVLTIAGVVNVGEIFALATVLGLAQVLDLPGRQMFAMDLVGREHVANAVALNSSLVNASRIIGPAIGGVLVAVAGAGVCFALNAASFVALLICLALIRREELVLAPRGVVAGHEGRAVVQGLRWVLGNREAAVVVVMATTIGLLAFNFNTLLPVLAKRTLHSDSVVFGILLACYGSGALVGALLAAARARSSWVMVAMAATGLGLAELLLATEGQVWACCLTLPVAGACFTTFTSSSQVTLQLLPPPGLRGRVLTVRAYALVGTAPLAGLLAGWMTERAGTGVAFAVGGAAATAAGLLGLAQWRRQRPVLDAAATAEVLTRPG